MKHLLLISLVTFLSSCSDKKEQIVEQIKSYKDSIVILEKRRADLNNEIIDIQGKYVGQQSLDSVAVVEKKQSAERAELFVKKLNYQGKIDSLELELKKY